MIDVFVSVVQLWGVWACVAAAAIGFLVMRIERRHSEIDRTQTRWAVGMLWLLAAVAIAWLVALTSYWWTVGPSDAYWRFWAPLIWAVLLAPVAMIDSISWRSRWVARGLHIVVLGLVLTALAWNPRPLGRGPLLVFGDFGAQPIKDLSEDRHAFVRDDYDRAAATIPPGAKVMAAVDAPSLLLGRGFAVHSIDLVGSTSPPPRLPYFMGSARKWSWLRGNGYDYVVATAPEVSTCLYNRTRQEDNLEAGGLYGAWAPFFLDWFALLDDARESPTMKADMFGSLLVIDVRAGSRA